MDLDDNRYNEVYGRIARAINELKMSKMSVTVFKVHQMTGIDQYAIFRYFYDKGLLKGK